MTNDLNYPNLAQICRLCLKDDQVLVEIFPKNDKDATAVKQLSIPMRIMACAALEVQSGDDLPQCICGECRYQLEKYFYFRKRAQLADNKLRKHLRLLSLGKKSTVFVKSAEDDDDVEELEFEDSLKFIKEQEDLRNKKELLQREKFKLDLELEKKTHEENIKKILEEKLKLLKKALEIELRQKMQHECLEDAKSALRLELKEQCRQEELNLLQIELETFLAKRRQKVEEKAIAKNYSTKCEEAECLPKSTEKTGNKSKTLPIRNTRKREQSPVLGKSKAAQVAESANNYENIDIKVAAESSEEFELITNENMADGGVLEIEHNENNTLSNFYIINKQNDDTFVASEESNQHDDNFLTETAFYQIEANGEIQTVESKSGILFKADQEEIDITEDSEELVYQTSEMLEYVNVKPTKSQTKNNHKSYKTKEYKKLKLEQPLAHNNNNNNNINVAIVQDDNINVAVVQDDNTMSLKLPYSRPTDTPKIFKCELCPMSFSTENTLNRHYRTHEQAEKRGVNFTCSECNVFFSCKSALSRHAIIHTGERPYKCEECGKSFVQREILKRHQQVHTGERPCQCPYCPRAYTQKVNLTQHINQHHSKTPKVKQHSCHLCQKRFNHASGLSRHLTTHSGIHYQCMECEKKFGDRSSIKRHIAMVHCKDNGTGEMTKEHDNALLKIFNKNDDNGAEL